MNTSTLRVILVATAVSLAPAAQADDIARDTGVGDAIAAQGNAALRSIRQELKFPVRVVKPALPARPPIPVQVVDGQQRPKRIQGRA